MMKRFVVGIVTVAVAGLLFVASVPTTAKAERGDIGGVGVTGFKSGTHGEGASVLPW